MKLGGNMNYCEKCGNKLEPNTQFCSSCVNQINNNKTITPKESLISNILLLVSLLLMVLPLFILIDTHDFETYITDKRAIVSTIVGFVILVSVNTKYPKNELGNLIVWTIVVVSVLIVIIFFALLLLGKIKFRL